MPSSLTDYRLGAFQDITSDPVAGPDEKIQRLLRFGCETFGLSVGILARIRGEDYEIFEVVPADDNLHRGIHFPLANTYCSRTIRGEDPVGFSQASGSEWERHPCFRTFRLEAYLGTRVSAGGQIWGTLGFSGFEKIARHFDEADFCFLKLMAQWIGYGLEWARHNEENARARADGSRRLMRWAAQRRLNDGTTAYAQVDGLFRALLRAVAEGIIGIDEKPPHRVRFINSFAENLLGIQEAEAVGWPLAGLIELLPDPGACCHAIGDWTRCPQHDEFEVALRTAGRPEGFPAAMTFARVAEGGMGVAVLTLHDISSRHRADAERKENENRILFLAEHDHLTGLPNRRMVEDRVRQTISSNRRRDVGLALMVIDLDRFKDVNDTFGHPVGDRLLIEVARQLVASVRTTDMVARLGGDEFIVLLEGMHSATDVAAAADKIHGALNQPIQVDGKTLHTPPSIGIGVYPKDGEDVETLLQNADRALYQVKSTGRNAWLFYTGEMNKAVRERMQMEADLRRSIEAGAFQLHFQPQIDLGTHRVVAWEALLRWHHSDRGWVEPEKFIPVAEETGLILLLGEWVLRTACTEVRRWETEGLGAFRISVNLSVRQFAEPGLADKVACILEETGLSPERLELEITESLVMGPSAQTLETIRQLKALGVSLTLDDFGAGYSSLACLKPLAVDRLKINRAFVHDIDRGPDRAAIANAMISLAQALDLDIAANGVETGHQTSFLAERGCRETQGFLTGRPMPGNEVAAFLASSVGTPPGLVM